MISLLMKYRQRGILETRQKLLYHTRNLRNFSTRLRRCKSRGNQRKGAEATVRSRSRRHGSGNALQVRSTSLGLRMRQSARIRRRRPRRGLTQRMTTGRPWLIQQRLLQHATRCSYIFSNSLVTGDEMAPVCYNLGSVYIDQGKLVEAEQMYQRALQGFEKAWGPEHTLTLDTVNSLGILYRSQGKLVEPSKCTSERCKATRTPLV